MLNKLIKYDLKWLNKVLIIYYIILLVLAVLIRCVESFEFTNIVVIIDKILSGAYFACIINIIINSILRLWIRFNLNIYKDESYLTHTLPVSKSKLFDSKELSGIISIILSIIVIIISALIVYSSKDNFEFIKSTYNDLNNIFKYSTILVIISFILVLIQEFIFMMNIGIFGLVIGNRFNNGKIIKSIIIGGLTYFITNILIIGIIYLIGKLNPYIMEFFKQGETSPNAIKQLIFIALIIYLVLNIFIYLISKIVFNKGVNVL